VKSENYKTTQVKPVTILSLFYAKFITLKGV